MNVSPGQQKVFVTDVNHSSFVSSKGFPKGMNIIFTDLKYSKTISVLYKHVKITKLSQD